MFVRRGQATVRLGAGLLLAMTCAAAPAMVLTPPAAGDATPPGACENMQPSASATSTVLGGPVEITGDCFPVRSTVTVEIFIQGDDSSRQTLDVNTEGGQSIYAQFTPAVAGDYQAVIAAGGASTSTTFTVEPAEEEPEDPDTGDGGDTGDGEDPGDGGDDGA
ncbi:MAG: hypothetical protein ACTHXC_10880, partial [Brachybacterium sp.]